MTAVSILAKDPRIAYGALPISADLPAGEDARSSPAFDEIDGEIRKLDTEGPNAVDWKKVANEGLAIVKTQSKDILVAAWVAFALFRREGLGGLGVGLGLLEGIIAHHWDGAVPPAKREKARVAAFDWLIGRITPVLSEMTYGDADAANLMAVKEALDRIDEDMSARLKKESLNLFELVRALRPHTDQAKRVLADIVARETEAAQRLDAEAGAKAAAAEAAASRAADETARTAMAAENLAPRPPEPVPAPALPAPAHAPAVAPQAPADLDALSSTLWSFARSLYRDNLGDPRSYTLGRLGSWLRFDAAPASQGGKTFIMPPAGLEAVEAAARQNQFDAALLAAEELVWTAPFCIDAHRHAYEMLGKLDRGFDAARAAVLGMLGYFALRFPGLADLTFSDGRPFADDATRELIAVASGGAGGGGPPDAMMEAVPKARGLIGAGKPGEALDLLAQVLRKSGSGRQRAEWQVIQARFCIEHGYVAAALPLLDHLDRLVETRDLEAWEPDLACAVSELKMRALMHPDMQMALVEDRRRSAIEAANGRLTRLDIGAAVRLLRT